MKGERKLRLVPPAALDNDERDERVEPPPTDDEIREARELRDAMDRGVDPLSASLLAAFRPASIDEEDSDALLARALGDADAAPTKAERSLADRLAGEIEARQGEAGERERSAPASEEAEIAGALQAAWAPRPIDPLKNEALIAQAVRRVERQKPRRGRVLSITMVSLATAAAMAAGVIIAIGRMASIGGAPMESAAAPVAAPMAAAQASFIRARSASELFDAATPFPRTGGESARIDKIAGARAADLRANRFAAWGVQ